MQVIKFYKKLLVILLSIILLSGCSNDEILLSDIVPLDLNDKLDSKLINKDYDVELYQSKGNLITGSILNLNGHPIIFKTEEIFTYDLKTHDIIFYDISEEGRIFDFKIIDNSIYYIILNGTDTELFDWNFVKYDINTKKSKILKSGVTIDPFNTPLILGDYNESLILFFINNDGLKLDYEFVKYDFKNFDTIICGNGKTQENVGTLPYNVYNYYLNDSKIYYTLLDEFGNQELYSYNLDDNSRKLLFENDYSSGLIYSYKINEEYKYIQIIYPNDNKSDIFIQKGTDELQKVSSEINTFANFISNDRLLFHNEGDKWKVFNLSSLEFTQVDIDMDSIPLYYILNNDEILISSKENKYFIVNIERLI